MLHLGARASATGAGPFVAVPLYAAKPHLLHVDLPKAATLHTQLASVVSMSGPLSTTMAAQPVPHLQVQLALPAALLLSAHSANYVKLDSSKTTRWAICDRRHLVAWSGLSVGFTPITVGKSRGLLSSGAGTLVVDAKRRLLEAEVGAGESLTVSPAALVACAGSTVRALYLGGAAPPRWRLAAGYVWGKVARGWGRLGIRLPPNLRASLEPAASHAKRVFDLLKLQILVLVRRKPIMLTVEGPCRVVLSDAPQTSNAAAFPQRTIAAVPK